MYDSLGTGGGPKNLLATTAKFTPVIGWNTQPVTLVKTLTQGTYWLAYLTNDNNLAFVNQQTGKTFWYSTTTVGVLPTVFVLAGSQSGNFHFSFYGTLNSSAHPDAHTSNRQLFLFQFVQPPLQRQPDRRSAGSGDEFSGQYSRQNYGLTIL